MKQKIIKILQNTYNAKWIMLHWSRARWTHHNSSDWDLLVFTDQVVKESWGEICDWFDLDIKVIQLPVDGVEEFIDKYPQSCQTMEVLIDTNDELLWKIKERAELRYSKRKKLSIGQKDYMKAHMWRMLSRLDDYIYDEEIFGYHLSSFYIKIIRYYFEYNGRWSQPIKEALRLIEIENPILFEQIKIICDKSCANIVKSDAAKRMVRIILQQRK